MTCLTDAFPDIPTPFAAIAYNAPGAVDEGGLTLTCANIDDLYVTLGLDTDPDTNVTHWCVDAYREDATNWHYVDTLVFTSTLNDATAMDIATEIMTYVPAWMEQFAAQ